MGVKLAANRPDLILCDINMPGIDGYETMRQVQNLPQCRDVPFIFLTAVADRSAQRRGMELGAADYITKPFTEKEIINAIAASVRRQLPLRERMDALVAERRLASDADWSHELMTPLNSVLGGLELIEAEADTIKPGELRELLQIIRLGAERQQVLSKKLVLYHEMERLRAAPAATPASCDASSFLTAGAQEAVQAERRASDLTLFCDHGTVRINGAHLRAAITELVVNACNFSKPGQPVTVTGICREGRYFIAVADEGVGLTTEQCEAIAPFRQFDRKRQNQQGLGLGLAIARTVAELGGGKLSLGPGPGGRGLRATLDLPCA